MIKILLILFLSLLSCASKISLSPQCNFPDSVIEKGGLIKETFKFSEKEKNIFKKNITCYEGAVKKIITPISFFSDDLIYAKDGIQLNNRIFRESKIIIKEKKFNNISNKDLERIKTESKIYKQKILSKFYSENISFPLHLPAEGVVSSEYGVRRFINNIPRNPHLGLDIAAASGTPIYAAESGLITLARNFFYKGNNILIDHGFDFKTSYSHLAKIVVNEGDLVKRGELIGFIGSTGRVTGPHLHFEVIFIGEKLNPEFFLTND